MRSKALIERVPILWCSMRVGVDEYQTMSIPTAISVPGAELVYRVGAIAPRPETLVVVNCAGRTRSIIGTQSLVNAGIANSVAALRNGTIGWLLAGHALEHGQTRTAPPVDAQTTQSAATAARAVADRAGVQRVTAEGARRRSSRMIRVRHTALTCACLRSTRPGIRLAFVARQAGNSCRRPMCSPRSAEPVSSSGMTRPCVPI